MRSNVQVRYATATDVKNYYQGPVAHTVKALVMEADDKVLAIGGIAYINHMTLAFMEMLPGAERFKLSLLKASRRAIVEWFRTINPLLALRDERIPTADNYLRHMGFAPFSADYYIWQGDESWHF